MRPPGKADAGPGGRKIRVLLVDDHDTVREALRLLLDGQPDMRVVGEAADGRGALAQALALRPDIMLLDLTMPGMTGLAIVRALKAVALPLKIVALTRHDDPAYVRELSNAGAAGYVLKQSRSARMLEALRTVAAGGRYYDPALGVDVVAPPKRTRAGRLTRRETDVLRRMALGQSNKETAADLGISIKTVEVHRTNAMRKLGMGGRTDVVRYAVLKGWLTDP
jgi:DNA-binding NarL/FixJ family response regulator